MFHSLNHFKYFFQIYKTRLILFSQWSGIYLISNSTNWMTIESNDLTTQATNWTCPWTNLLEQLNRKLNNDGISSFLQRWQKNLQRKKRKVLCDKKELEKAILLQTRIKHFKNKSTSYCWIFFQFSNWPWHFYVDWSKIPVSRFIQL